MLDIQQCCLTVVDVQGKLAQLMHGREALFKNIRILVNAANILEIPILWCQQCPDALGPTVPEIAKTGIVRSVSDQTLSGLVTETGKLKPDNKNIICTTKSDSYRLGSNLAHATQIFYSGFTPFSLEKGASVVSASI